MSEIGKKRYVVKSVKLGDPRVDSQAVGERQLDLLLNADDDLRFIGSIPSGFSGTVYVVFEDQMFLDKLEKWKRLS